MVDRITESCKRIRRDPELLSKLMTGVSGPRDFVKNVVVEGRRFGYEFTYQDAHAVMRLHDASTSESGEILVDLIARG